MNNDVQKCEAPHCDRVAAEDEEYCHFHGMQLDPCAEIKDHLKDISQSLKKLVELKRFL